MKHGNMVKVGHADIKEFFTHSIKDLDNLLSEIIKRNANFNLEEIIETSFNREIASYFEQNVQTLNILNYKGEASTIPSTATVGSVYKVDNNYYLFYETSSYRQIYTLENINEILQNFYTKDEVNDLLDQLNNRMENFEEIVSSGIQEMEAASNDFVTQAEFVEKFSIYEQQLNDYRESYETQLQNIRDNWIAKTNALDLYKQRNTQNINDYVEKYNKLKNKVATYQDQIDLFKSDISGTISSAIDQNLIIQEQIIETSGLLSATQIIMNDYEDLIAQMSQTIDILSGKLEELMREDQRIIQL